MNAKLDMTGKLTSVNDHCDTFMEWPRQVWTYTIRHGMALGAAAESRHANCVLCHTKAKAQGSRKDRSKLHRCSRRAATTGLCRLWHPAMAIGESTYHTIVTNCKAT